LKSLQRNSQLVTLTELQTIEVPLRVVDSEPDIHEPTADQRTVTVQRETTVTCVQDSQLFSAIHETAPHIVILDVYSFSIRRALNWEMLGIQEAPATIITGFDPSAVSTVAQMRSTFA
jgi:hypothetical protein